MRVAALPTLIPVRGIRPASHVARLPPAVLVVCHRGLVLLASALGIKPSVPGTSGRGRAGLGLRGGAVSTGCRAPSGIEQKRVRFVSLPSIETSFFKTIVQAEASVRAGLFVRDGGRRRSTG
jgi:hypothetical protein